MSDSKRLVYGSLEDKERQRQEQANKDGEATLMGNAAIQAAIRAGNINIADAGKTEVLELTETSKEAQDRHATLLKKLEAEKRKRVLYVPTNPAEVIHKLREMGEPITLFGEKVGDRRERLREIMAVKDLEQEAEKKVEGLLGVAPPGVLASAEVGGLLPRGVAVKAGEAAAKMEVEQEGGAEPRKAELFYTVGGPELVEARKVMADFSFKRAPERLQALKRRREAYSSGRDGTDEARRLEADTGKLYDRMRRLEINQSQLGDDRPLGAIRINPGGDLIATGSWTNVVKVWDLDNNLGELTCLAGHTERISSVAWKPEPGDGGGSGMDVDGGAKLRGFVASASVDGTAKLWNVTQKTAVQTFTGHAARLAQVEFHPSGRFIGTTSWDYTWRLWDVETGQELMLQDGHFKETHAITFQCDGALVMTGDYSGVGHVWDLRSGKSIWVLQGHSLKIVAADFHPNGYQVATGSGENIVKLWDIRKKKNFYTLPAHVALISSVRFAPTSGEFLATASFDGQAKLWGTRDYRLLKQLSGHEGRLVGIDITPDEKRIVTASHDRTFKLWAEAE